MSLTTATIKNIGQEELSINGFYFPTIDENGKGVLMPGESYNLFIDHTPSEVFSSLDLKSTIENDQVIFVVEGIDLGKQDSLEYYLSQTARSNVT